MYNTCANVTWWWFLKNLVISIVVGALIVLALWGIMGWLIGNFNWAVLWAMLMFTGPIATEMVLQVRFMLACIRAQPA